MGPRYRANGRRRKGRPRRGSALALDDFGVADLGVFDALTGLRFDAAVGGGHVDLVVLVETALEVLDRLTDTVAQLRQLVGAEYQQHDHEDDEKLSHSGHAHGP